MKANPIYAGWREQMGRPIPVPKPRPPRQRRKRALCSHGVVGQKAIKACTGCHPHIGRIGPCPHGVFPKKACKPCYNARRRRDCQVRRDRDPAAHAARAKRWRTSNPQAYRTLKTAYRHRVRAVGQISGDDVRTVLERDRLCTYCGLCASTTIDHVLPLSHGGTNAFENLVGACHPCNSSKNGHLLAEWLGRMCPACGMATGSLLDA
jgi:5-methylcytosine-specific restriction endonuclease McrA